MPWMASVSWSLIVPFGPVFEPPDKLGLANLLCEMTLRGAGGYSSRDFLSALENLGCETTESLAHLHTVFSGSVIAENLLPALSLLADQVRRPILDASELQPAKQVLRQDIYSLEDDQQQLLMREMFRTFLPNEWGRSNLGTIESIETISIDDLHGHFERYYQPAGAILSVAGKFDWREVIDKIELLFGAWIAKPITPPIECYPSAERIHIPFDSAQTHIAIAFPSVPFGKPDHLKAWSSVGILSGGMSSRLFDELREKRGLCYNVFASYFSLLNQAGIYCYCGSERADDALESLLDEIHRLQFGVEEEELVRLKIRTKSSLVSQRESTAARSSAMICDYYHLGRIRSIEEIEASVVALTKRELDEFFASHPPGPFHIVTIGD